jgi:hypothetical protein
MVIVAALRAAFRIAARLHAHIHGVDGSAVLSKGVASDQLPQSSFIAPSSILPSLSAAYRLCPRAATVHRLQAQVDRRRDNTGCEDSLGEFEQSVGVAIEALVEGVTEGAQSVKGSGGRFHSEAFCPQGPLEATRCVYFFLAQLKHKLRVAGEFLQAPCS